MWPVALMGARCVCCSGYVRDAFRGVPGVARGLFTAVWNCVRVGEVRQNAAAARMRRAAGEPFTAIMVATLEPHKDHETLLRAVPAIRAQRAGFRLRLVGSGKLRMRLEALVNQLGIADAVEFLGTRRDVPDLLGQADLFIFSTTEQEGLGTVLVEALAAGLPVVASDVPACRELLQGGEFGCLFTPGNAEALASAVLAFTPDESTARATAQERYLERFSATRMMGEYLGLAGVGPESVLSQS